MVVLFNIFDDNSIVKLDIINRIHTFNFMLSGKHNLFVLAWFMAMRKDFLP